MILKEHHSSGKDRRIFDFSQYGQEKARIRKIPNEKEIIFHIDFYFSLSYKNREKEQCSPFTWKGFALFIVIRFRIKSGIITKMPTRKSMWASEPVLKNNYTLFVFCIEMKILIFWYEKSSSALKIDSVLLVLLLENRMRGQYCTEYS